ncbi:LuxR C-terminal-related transcriptional regulator [Nesterenkonia suensis]
MTQLPDHIRTTELRLPHQLAGAFLDDPAGTSWILHLPGHWGVDALVEELHRAGPTSVLDGTGGTFDVTPEHGDEPTPEPQRAAGPVVLLWPELLAAEALEDALGLLTARRRRLLVVVRSFHDLPTRLLDLEATGRLRNVIPGALSVRELGVQTRQRLGGAISLKVLRRLYHLSAGQPVLADRLLTLAQDVRVIRETSGYWEWDGHEDPLHQALADAADRSLMSFTQEESELLTLVAIAGRLPEQHAMTRSGDGACRSLMAQGILAREAQAPRGYADLRITAEALRSMLLTRMRWTDHLRWWQERGRDIPADSGGEASYIALTWWRVRVDQRVEPGVAEDLARRALPLSWYTMMRGLVALCGTPTARLQVLVARAEYALGDVDAALDRLAALPDDASLEEIREAILVAERIRLFLPEKTHGLLASLRDRAGDSSPTQMLDSIRAATLDAGATEELLSQLQSLRASPDCDEALLSQLWAGALLGLRHQSDIGREVLSSLIDALRREGGHPDVEECAVAVLLLITATSGWRIDMIRVETDVWNERRLRCPALAGVADLLAAIAALQDDQLRLAHQCARSAATIHARGDSFGLHWFSRMLVAAAAGCLTGVGSPSAEPWQTPGPPEGFPWLHQVGEGLRFFAEESSPQDTRARLEELVSRVADEGETVQEQVLLLFALLRGSQNAAQRVLEAPWREDPGRPQLTTLFAEAQGTEATERMLDVAEHLIATRSRLFGLSLLARLWGRRADMDRALRIRLVNLVLDSRPGEGKEPSALLGTFDIDLTTRECAVLDGLRTGWTTSQVARRMNISPRTVEATISTMLRRFGCANRMELLALHLGPPAPSADPHHC